MVVSKSNQSNKPATVPAARRRWILSFTPYGSRGWLWITPYGTFRTNKHGEGKWYCAPNGEEHQTHGTTQYSLPSDRARASERVRYELKKLSK